MLTFPGECYADKLILEDVVEWMTYACTASPDLKSVGPIWAQEASIGAFCGELAGKGDTVPGGGTPRRHFV